MLGFPVSNKLWKNVAYGLSAGRVQSPAIRIVVDREKERTKFVKSEYWSVSAQIKKDDILFDANLVRQNDNKIASGKDFDKNNGNLKTKNCISLDNTLSKYKSAPTPAILKMPICETSKTPTSLLTLSYSYLIPLS